MGLEAVRCERYAVVKVLVAKGADLEAKDQDGKAALELAESNGNMQIQDLFRAALEKQKVLTLSSHRVQDDRFHITCASMQGDEIEVHVSTSASVLDLRRCIADRLGIFGYQVKLLLGAARLDEGSTPLKDVLVA